jgi:hypothetical protein
MAVTHNPPEMHIILAAAGDAVELPLWVKSIRVVSSAPVDADRIQLTNAIGTATTIWETYISGIDEYVEEVLVERWWRRGVRLNTNTGNRAQVHIYYQ